MFFQAVADIGARIAKLNRNEILSEIWRMPEVQDFIINLNTEKQLRIGDLANGQKTPELDPNYLESKRAIYGRDVNPTPFTNFRLTGEFYETFDIKVLDNGFLIIANTTIYGRDFIKDYGFDILGLTDESIDELISYIRPIWIQKIEERILKNV